MTIQKKSYFDNLPIPTRRLNGTIVNTPYGPGYYNPNNPISHIPIDDELEDGSTITGSDGQKYTVTKQKTPEEELQDKVKSQAQNEVFKQGKQLLVGGAAGRATASDVLGGAGKVNISQLPEGQVVNIGAPEAPGLISANRLGSSGEVLSSGAPEVSGWSLKGIGSSGNYILPIAGAYGLYDLYSNRPENVGTGKGYLEGAASGAALGSYFGPVGAGIGAGLGIIGNAFGIGGKSRTKIEEDRRQALADQGITVPNFDTKEWENNPIFAKSRKESDLTGKDIENAATFYGITGYAGADAAKKEAIAQEAINKGLIREHHGTIDLSMTPEYQEYLKTQLGGGQPTSSGGGVDRRAMEAENKKQRKRAALSSIMPTIDAEITQGPRYDINPGNLLNNPYL